MEDVGGDCPNTSGPSTSPTSPWIAPDGSWPILSVYDSDSGDYDSDIDRQVLDSSEELGEKIFQFTAENPTQWFVPVEISGVYCTHWNGNIRGLTKCPCLGIQKRNSKFVLEKATVDDMILIFEEIMACKYLGDNAAKRRYQTHRAVIFALTTGDRNIAYENRDRSLAAMYNLRSIYGFTKDYGLQQYAYQLKAESDDGSGNGFIQSIIETLRSGVLKTKNTVQDVIRFIMERVRGAILMVTDLISRTLSSVLNRVMDMIASVAIRIFNPLDTIGETFAKYSKNVLISIVVALMLLAIVEILGFFAFRILSRFLRGVVDYCFSSNYDQQKADKFQARISGEGPSAIGPIVAMIGAYVGVKKSSIEYSTIAKRCRETLTILAAGTAAAGMAGAILLVLPDSIVSIVEMFSGRTDAREKMIIDGWVTRTHALVTMARTPRVLLSPKYEEWINEQYTEWKKLRPEIKGSLSVGILNQAVANLIRIKTHIGTARRQGERRDQPFSIHMAAVPGIGKSLLSKKLIHDSFDIDDVYFRNSADEFWSGYADNAAVVYDEFMSLGKDARERIAEEYLFLVSSQTFKPLMPSTDDITCGIKGSEVKPSVVMTINNHAYTSVAGIDNNALWRRRKYVILANPNPNFRIKFENSEVKLSEMTEDELRNVEWISFDILPSVPSGDLGKKNYKDNLITGLKYTELVELLRTDYAQYKDVCNVISSTLGCQSNFSVPVEQMLEDVLREMRGVPKAKEGWFDTILGVFKNRPTAEGPHEKGNKKQQRSKKKKALDQINKNDQTKMIDDILVLLSAMETRDNRMFISIAVDALSGVCKDQLTVDQDFKIRDFLMTEAVKRGMTKGEAKIVIDDLMTNKMPDISNIVQPSVSASETKNTTNEAMEDNVSCSSSSTSEFQDASNEATFDDCDAMQKDTLADIFHKNIDPSKLHRHMCLSCFRQFAHKHPEMYHLPQCPKCKENGRELDFHQPVLSRSTTRLVQPVIEAGDVDALSQEDRVELKKRVFKSLVNAGWNVMMHTHLHVCEKVDEWITCSDVVSRRVDSWKYVLALSVSVFVACYTYKKFRERSEGEERTLDFYSISHESPFKEKGKKTARRNRPRMQTHMRGQGPMKSVFITTNNGVIKGIPICGRTFVTYFHGLSDLLCNDDVSVKIQYGTSTDHIPLAQCVIMSNSENDLVFVTMPSTCKINVFSDMRKRFWTEDELESTTNIRVRLDISGGPRAAMANMVIGLDYDVDAGGDPRVLENALIYRMPTKQGDCGTVVMSIDDRLSGRILGMHVAGGDTRDGHVGVATLLTREMISDVFKNDAAGIEVPTLLTREGPHPFYGFNLRKVEQVPVAERVYAKDKTSIRPSCLSPWLGIQPDKCLPILSDKDPRSNGVDPGINMINDMLAREHPSVNMKRVDRIYKDMREFYEDKLVWPIGKRDLTIEEAIGGIPGLLSSMPNDTSPGYPLVLVSKKRGKADWFSFGSDGQLLITDELRDLVIQFKNYTDNIEETVVVPKLVSDGPTPLMDTKFLTYLKDELVSPEKIQSMRTRLIYCGDLVKNVVYRMRFGALIIAIHASYANTPSCIGLNQYSYDMDKIFKYLSVVGDNYIAGDFKNFDKNIVPWFQWASYGLLMDLAGIKEKFFRTVFLNEQVRSPIQYKEWRIWFKNTHLSGCFFTTILNNMVHEGYVRYIWQTLCPNLDFSTHMRFKVYGDDHIYCVSDAAKDFNPLSVSIALNSLSQKYTGADKKPITSPAFSRFNEITFLGASMTLLDGQWCGRMHQATIERMLLWTRNNDRTIRDEVGTAIEMASLWDSCYYNKIVNLIIYAFSQIGMEVPHIGHIEEVKRTVANRTGGSEYDWPRVHHLEGPVLFTQEGDKPTLTQLNVTSSVASKPLIAPGGNRLLMDLSMNERPMNLEYSTDSKVFRAEFKWNTSDVLGKVIWQIDVPFGLLSLSSDSNVQNHPFKMYTFWNGDVELTFQINGHQFSQGLLVATFCPLADYEFEYTNLLTPLHVLLQPSKSSTAVLRVPFVYLRNFMNTQARATESLGTVHVRVLLPLKNVDSTSHGITVFSSFPNSTFRIPYVELPSIRNRRFQYTSPRGAYRHSRDVVKLRGEGIQSSKVTNIYSNVSGSMPVGGNVTSLGMEQTPTVDVSPDLSLMPLDNPPLASGSIPVVQAFPGFSNVVGVRPTSDLQMFPAALYNQQSVIFNPVETKISTLLGKECILYNSDIKEDQPTGTELYTCFLDTRMSQMEGEGSPLNVAVINQFVFWRADVVFTITLAKTMIHSTRLQAMFGYSSPGFDVSHRNSVLSQVLDFSGDQEAHSFRIPWNHQTEFLRTYEGPNVLDPLQNYSLGTFKLIIYNPLVSPPSVVSSVDFIVTFHYENAHVAVPRAQSAWTFNDYMRLEAADGFIAPKALDRVYGFISTGNNSVTLPYDQLDIKVSNAIIGFRGYHAHGFMLITLRSANADVLREYRRTITTVFWDGLPTGNPEFRFDEPMERPEYDNWRSMAQFVLIRIGEAITLEARYEAPTESVALAAYNARKAKFDAQVSAHIPNPIDERRKTAFEKAHAKKVMAVRFVAEGPVVAAEDMDETVEPSMTATETKEITHVACEQIPNTKFPFQITDVHEMGRRYIRLALRENPALDQFVVRTRMVGEHEDLDLFNFSVQPNTFWRSLFAAWAGSVKYRFLDRTKVPGHVIFQPYINTQNQIGVPVVDLIEGNLFRHGDIVVQSSTATAGSYARERMYQFSTEKFLDVSAPFQSHYNFCYNSDTQEIAPISSGTMTVAMDSEQPSEVYTCFGDDLRLGVFRPPRKTMFSLQGLEHGVGGYH